MNPLPSICKKCGSKHFMVLEDKENGTLTPIDYCKGCLFGQYEYVPIKEKIALRSEEAT